MESAIPEHLRCPRTHERRVADDHTPPYPGWSARAPVTTTQVVMGYFGVQSRGPAMQGRACAALLNSNNFHKTAAPPSARRLLRSLTSR